MKEFIEKLIGRLEELKTEAFDKWDGGASHRAYSKSIEIVNELAEEYINTSSDTSTDTSSGYCEWKLIDEEKSVYKSGCEKQRFYDGNPTESMYEFCPYCGKKIKVEGVT